MKATRPLTYRGMGAQLDRDLTLYELKMCTSELNNLLLQGSLAERAFTVCRTGGGAGGGNHLAKGQGHARGCMYQCILRMKEHRFAQCSVLDHFCLGRLPTDLCLLSGHVPQDLVELVTIETRNGHKV